MVSMRDARIAAYKFELEDIFEDPVRERKEARLAEHLYSLLSETRKSDTSLGKQARDLYEVMSVPPQTGRERSLVASEDSKAGLLNLGIFNIAGSEYFSDEELIEMEAQLAVQQLYYCPLDQKQKFVEDLIDSYGQARLAQMQSVNADATSLPMQMSFQLTRVRREILGDDNKWPHAVYTLKTQLLLMQNLDIRFS